MCEIRPNHWRGRKGGESMSLEAMKQVTEAEQTTRAQKAEAEAQAKRLVAEAERDGKAALAQARADAEARSRNCCARRRIGRPATRPRSWHRPSRPAPRCGSGRRSVWIRPRTP